MRYERRRSATGRRGSTLPLHTRSGLRDSESDSNPVGLANANSDTGYPDTDSHTDSDPGDANSNTGHPDTNSGDANSYCDTDSYAWVHKLRLLGLERSYRARHS